MGTGTARARGRVSSCRCQGQRRGPPGASWVSRRMTFRNTATWTNNPRVIAHPNRSNPDEPNDTSVSGVLIVAALPSNVCLSDVSSRGERAKRAGHKQRTSFLCCVRLCRSHRLATRINNVRRIPWVRSHGSGLRQGSAWQEDRRQCVEPLPREGEGTRIDTAALFVLLPSMRVG